MREGSSEADSCPQCTKASKAKHEHKVLDLPHRRPKERLEDEEGKGREGP